MEKMYAHYSYYGHSMAPNCADALGYIAYREGFQERISRQYWTRAEKWIDSEDKRIEEFRKR